MKKLFFVIAGLCFCLTPKISDTASVDFQQITEFPFFPEGTGVAAGPTLVSTTLDAAGESTWQIMQISRTVTISTIGFVTGTVTTGATVTFRIEGVNLTTGFPDGNLFCANSSGTVSVAGIDDQVYKESDPMVQSCTIPASTYVAVGLLHAGSFNGNVQPGYSDDSSDFGYKVSSTSTAGYAKAAAASTFSLKETNGNYLRGYVDYAGYAIGGVPAIVTYQSGTNPNTRGNLFRIKRKVRAIGVRTWIDLDNSATIKLWQYGSTIIATATLNSALDASAAGQVMNYYFDAPVWLNANEYYRLTLTPNAAANVSIYQFLYNSSNQLDTGVVMGLDCIETTANNPTSEASWTNTNTKRETLYLLVDLIDVGIPGGGFGVGQ